MSTWRQQKKTKAERKAAKDLKIYAFCRKTLQSAQERALLGLRIYLWKYTQKVAASSPWTLPQLYLVFRGRAQLEHSSHIVKMLHANTSSPDVDWRKQLNRRAHLKLSHVNPDILERVLYQIALSISTAGKWAPMNKKQPEHGRTLTTEEQRRSSAQANYD